MLLKNLILTTSILIAASFQVAAMQSSGNSDNKPEIRSPGLTIHEGNFSCFQDLNCLVRENPFKSVNLGKVALNRNSGYEQYILEGSTRNEEIYAVYDNGGSLVKATLVQRNIILPKNLRNSLASDSFSEWTMVGNELFVENFDKNKMHYKVVLMRNEEVRVEYFDRKGNQINRFI